jgi:hypothetical protein
MRTYYRHLRLALLTAVAAAILTLSLTIPVHRAQAGFTPTPAPPTDTPGPPTNTPLPPTATPVPPTSAPAPTHRPKNNEPPNQPESAEPTPTPVPPMPETGQLGWWPMALLLWAASLLLVLPMMGPLRKRRRERASLFPARKRAEHDRANDDIQ